jgi:hypothetical protein
LCASHFLFVGKDTPPWFTKFEFEKFFTLFYIISTQRSYIYKKPATNRCFAKLRAISNLFSFFWYTLYSLQPKTFIDSKRYLFKDLFVLCSSVLMTRWLDVMKVCIQFENNVIQVITVVSFQDKHADIQFNIVL